MLYIEHKSIKTKLQAEYSQKKIENRDHEVRTNPMNRKSPNFEKLSDGTLEGASTYLYLP